MNFENLGFCFQTSGLELHPTFFEGSESQGIYIYYINIHTQGHLYRGYNSIYNQFPLDGMGSPVRIRPCSHLKGFLHQHSVDDTHHGKTHGKFMDQTHRHPELLGLWGKNVLFFKQQGPGNNEIEFPKLMKDE